MNYLLAVLTHGDAPTLGASLESMMRHVTPSPVGCVIHRDGPVGREAFQRLFFESEPYPPPNFVHAELSVSEAPVQEGFCKATQELWHRASSVGNHDYVFWLEHDFALTRDIDLRPLAAVLDADPKLAQMQLMRNAVNEQEQATGGLFESRRDQYAARTSSVSGSTLLVPWLAHRAYMTTNPCLMRREFMQQNPWPDYADQCEGRFGIDLLDAGYYFGVWGNGEPWVEHIGVRDGFGY